MRKKTLWFARDRRGDHYFTRRPSLVAMHDIFEGPEHNKRVTSRHRVIRKFISPVKGAGGLPPSELGYPNAFKVGYK